MNDLNIKIITKEGIPINVIYKDMGTTFDALSIFDELVWSGVETTREVIRYFQNEDALILSQENPYVKKLAKDHKFRIVDGNDYIKIAITELDRRRETNDDMPYILLDLSKDIFNIRKIFDRDIKSEHDLNEVGYLYGTINHFYVLKDRINTRSRMFKSDGSIYKWIED